ncbi:MAG: cupin domain-containing protein [Actinobacteria bacterium]|nr:cupin domain-containing protein [Actinomycetota bacterium]
MTTHPGSSFDWSDLLRQRRPDGGLVVKAADAPRFEWSDRNQLEIYPTEPFKPKTIGFHIGEMPANRSTGSHRHSCEAILYILEGSGHTIVDGETFGWEAGDSVYVPPMAWHSHHSGPSGSRMIGVWNVPLMEALGLYVNEEAGDTGNADAEPSVRTTLLPSN